MTKSDDLLKQMGANVAESIGVRQPRPALQAAKPAQEITDTAPRNGFTRLRSAGEMLLENIVPDPNQPRKEFDPDAIRRLAESIKARGILQPLRIRWNPELGKHVILVGERRYRAAIAAGLTAVPCIFVEAELTEGEILEEQLVENLLREDLNPIEQATSFQRYMELLGCPAKELAELLKVNPSTVTRALALLKLPEPIREQVATGDIAPVTGYELSKVKDALVQGQMAEQVVNRKMTADETAKAVRKKKGAATRGRGVAETFRVGNNFKVVVSAPRKAKLEDIVAALEAALEQARGLVD